MNRIWNWPPANFMRELGRLYFDRDLSRAAAALTYFLLLSVFPLLICVNAFLGLLRLDGQTVFRALSQLIPGEAAALVGDYLAYVAGNQSGPMLAAGLIALTVSASAALRTLMDTMDRLYGREGRGGLRRTLVSVALSLLFLATMYLSIVVVLTGDWFLRLVERVLPEQIDGLIDFPGLAGLWGWMKFLLLFCFVMLLVLAVYRLGAPKRGIDHPPVVTGAVLASAALVGASAVFSWFIGLSSRYSLLYGSLASVIILMVWLYLCGNILMLGSAFNCLRWRHKCSRPE